MKEVEGVRDIFELQQWLIRFLTPVLKPSIKNVVKDFLQGNGHYQPSWRAMIFALDGAKETHVSNRIKHYAEPVQGRC